MPDARLSSLPVVDRPIFVVAPHRSGTTLLLDTLARHEQVAAFTRVHQRMDWTPRGAALADRALGALLGPRRPHEAQHVWDRFLRRDDDVLTASDVTDAQRAYFHAMIGRTLAARRRTRFVAKYPRLSLRVGWLDALFPDAVFVHLRRDWRAVVSSTVKRKRKRAAYSDRWFGVRIPGWQALGSSSDEEQSAAIFRCVTQELEAWAQRLGPRMLVTSYEQLCADPHATLAELCDRASLPHTARFEKSELTEIRAASDTWRSHLDPAVVESIRAGDRDFYARHEH
jgi:LPS sulfotransferase NodH